MAAIIAAAMANLSAALNSLASATVVDFYQPLTRSRYSPAHYLGISRFSTIFWGGVLAAIALVASHWGSVLESGLSIASVTLGILLGVFLLGVLTKRPGENAAIAGVIAGAAVDVLRQVRNDDPVHVVGIDRKLRDVRRGLPGVIYLPTREPVPND